MVKFQDIVPYMDQVRQKLTKVLESFGPDEMGLREVPNGWSVTEIVEHLGKLEIMIQYQLKQMLEREPVQPSEPLEEKVTDVSEILSSSGIIGKKIKAPEQAMPSGMLTYEEAMDKLNRVRETTKQIITKLAERNTNDLHDPHPYGFKLNAAQWAHFIAIHETLHIRQLGRIREENQ